MRREYAWLGLAAGVALAVAGVAKAGRVEPWKAPESARRLANPLAGDRAALDAGRKLFAQQCAPCHGEGGRGDGAAGTYLPTRPADLTAKAVADQSDGELFWKITSGRAPMPTFQAMLDDTQRWQLVAYLRALQGRTDTVGGGR